VEKHDMKTPAEILAEPVLQLVTVRQAAAQMHVSVGSVYNLMAAGELPYVKIGKCRRLRLQDVLSYITRNTVNEAQAA
jgi:excisionase family DNA binding protein